MNVNGTLYNSIPFPQKCYKQTHVYMCVLYATYVCVCIHRFIHMWWCLVVLLSSIGLLTKVGQKHEIPYLQNDQIIVTHLQDGQMCDFTSHNMNQVKNNTDVCQNISGSRIIILWIVLLINHYVNKTHFGNS